MPIIVDGVTIQDCEGVTTDGVDTELVKADNTTVYDEVCFQGIWSGSTYELTMMCENCYGWAITDGGGGLEMSGAQYRMKYTYATGSCTTAGPIHSGWLTANQSGLGSGTISLTLPTTGYTAYVQVTNTTLINYWNHTSSEGTLYFDTVNKFSGQSQTTIPESDLYKVVEGYESSGGQTRYYERHYCNNSLFYDRVGAWVTLN